jgi:hypothetical protein
MANRTQHRQAETTEDSPIDIVVWRAVRYLDSPTNYRECLPQSGRPLWLHSEFVTLDDGQFPWGKLCLVTVLAILVSMILLLWLRS